MNEEEVLNLVNKMPNNDAISIDMLMFDRGLTTHETSTYPSAVVSSDRTPTFERELEEDIPINISVSLLQNLFTDLHQECESKILDQKTLMIDLTEKWQKKCNKLTNLRNELNDLDKSLVEPGSMFLHINHEVLEERNTLKRKDQAQRKSMGSNIKVYDEHDLPIEKDQDTGKHIITDSPQLMCMSKEELISYFKTEMTMMNRRHEAALQEKTEELFIQKREFLKEKGSSHLNLKRDKEVELVRNRIAEIVSKLDDILLENENLSTIHDDHEGLCSLREKNYAIFLENQHMLYILAAKKKETPPDHYKMLNAANQLPNLFVGGEDVDQIEKLQEDIEVLKFETSIKDAINKSALQELYDEFRDRVEGMEMETKIDQCTCSFILGEVARDALSRINSVMMKCFEERNNVYENLLAKQKALSVEVEENKRLKQQIESSSTLLKTKAIISSNLEAALARLSGQCDSVCDEYDALRERVIKQELIMAESQKEYDLINCSLKENFYQIHQHQAEIDKINQNFKVVSVALQEAEKQKSLLQAELWDIEANFTSEVTKMKEQRNLVLSILTSMSQLQYIVKSTIEINESRLKALCYQCHGLSKQADLVKKKVMSYKEMFERKCEDLRKAEIEVDLLGDEVDNLSSLCRSIYFTLEHYSPVLQCYPGVMEVLKLIRRKMKVEAGDAELKLKNAKKS